MSDDFGGRVDIIVEGRGRSRYNGWRLEVFRSEHHHLIRNWTSDSSVEGDEFGMIGDSKIHVDAEIRDYEILLSGCARHLCSDGVSGYLLYSGRTSKVSKAKVVATDLTRSPDSNHTYTVTFSEGIDALSMDAIEREICSDNAISTKSGLPFPCKNP
jgi:hypothetical protein